MTHKPLHKQAGIGSRAMVANILEMYSRATTDDIMAGMVWYKDARTVAEVVADISGQSIESAAVAIAHLSPQMSWDDNVAYALALAEPDSRYDETPNNRAAGARSGCMYASWKRAYRALYWSETPLADMTPSIKTHAFAHNILGDTHYVTIDSWAMRIAGMSNPERIKRVGVYAGLSDAYRRAAAIVGVEPSEIQAITWVAAHTQQRNARLVDTVAPF
ncbi:hypothetical protein SEA_JONJAMES_202 [Gordonia Phage JonJames]|nr:hypothetical protein SEA_JONJAMES_202 [Gordonia Phage JonJames]